MELNVARRPKEKSSATVVKSEKKSIVSKFSYGAAPVLAGKEKIHGRITA